MNGTFRSLLDAALSSPTGRGVIVDEAGRFAGTITAANVVKLLEQQQLTHQQPAHQQPAQQQTVSHQQPSAAVAP